MGGAGPVTRVRAHEGQIRALSARAGLPTASKPAAPCLSSRVAYGVRVTPERLRRIDRAEDFLLGLGFDDLRVRDHGDLARVEVPPARLAEVAAHAETVSARLRALGWTYVTLDLAGLRSGSMNEVLPPPRLRRGGENVL